MAIKLQKTKPTYWEQWTKSGSKHLQWWKSYFNNSSHSTVTVYQGKAKKNMVILSTLHPSVTVADNSKKIPGRVKLTLTKIWCCIVNQMARKYTVRTSTRRWPRGYIRSITHCGYKYMDHLQKGHKEQHTQKCFSSAVDWEELSWPHSRKQQHKGERSNTKKTQLQEETPDK